MRILLMTLAFLALTSCGKFATKEELGRVSDDVSSLENRISNLEDKVSANVEAMSNLSISLDTTSDKHNTINAMLNSLQLQTTKLQAKQAALELENRVIGFYDPCPSVSSKSFKEVLFEMSSGEVVGYFQDGGKRFLTVLKTGTTYRTTDSRACTFVL